MAGEPSNKVDGWELVDYEWDQRSGLGRFRYEQNGRTEREVCKPQMRWQLDLPRLDEEDR